MPQDDGSNVHVVLAALLSEDCTRSDAVSRPVVASALGDEEIGIVGVSCLGFREAGEM